ncbi:MAG: hypothetical protein E7158_04270 [Firmicutes bacterium]|nr:hypothetical protein [Bacillota bacterium]
MQARYETSVDCARRNAYKNQVERYKKNSEALANEILLYEALKKSEGSDDVIIWTLADTFIKNLEDKDIKLPLVGNSITEIIEKNYETEEYRKIIRMCDLLGYNDISCKLKEDYRLTQLRKEYYNHDYNSFDIIKIIFDKSPAWILELLASDLRINTKINILTKILSYISENDNCKIYKILNCDFELLSEIGRTEYRVAKDRMEKLKVNFKNQSPNLQSMFEKIYLKSGGEELLLFLNNNGYIDLSKVSFMYGKEKKLEISPISLFTIHNSIESLEEYRNSKEYSFDNKLTNNDDLFLIEQINYKDLPKLICLPSFILNEEKIDAIAKKILFNKTFDNKDFNNLVSEIKSTIIHKARIKKEYKELMIYAQLFEELISDDKEIVPDYNSVLNLFIGQMYELNEYAQENVPSRRLVREVKYQKDSVN